MSLQNFLGRLPIGFNVVILSPHGFFGQANVLGKPDTGGQVTASPTTLWINFPHSCLPVSILIRLLPCEAVPVWTMSDEHKILVVFRRVRVLPACAVRKLPGTPSQANIDGFMTRRLCVTLTLRNCNSVP